MYEKSSWWACRALWLWLIIFLYRSIPIYSPIRTAITCPGWQGNTQYWRYKVFFLLTINVLTPNTVNRDVSLGPFMGIMGSKKDKWGEKWNQSMRFQRFQKWVPNTRSYLRTTQLLFSSWIAGTSCQEYTEAPPQPPEELSGLVAFLLEYGKLISKRI